MTYDLRIECTLLDVRRACAWLRRCLASRPTPLAERAELVLAEALNNIVLHTADEHPDRHIAIQLILDPGTLRLLIRDDGPPLWEVPDEAHPVAMPDPFDEHGRGWAMIAAYTSTFAYHPGPDGNELALTLLDPA